MPCSQQKLVLCLGASKDMHIMLSSSFLADFAGLSVVVLPFQVLEPQGAAAWPHMGPHPCVFPSFGNRYVSKLWAILVVELEVPIDSAVAG